MRMCNTCRHWIRESYFSRVIDHHPDSDQQYPADYGCCQRIHVEGNDRHHRSAPDEIDNPILVLPGAHRAGGLVLTHERFGCQMHEGDA